MSQDISDNSSDEEVAPQTNEAPTQKRTTRYECPEEFTRASYAPCLCAKGRSTLDENKELWLIKAPANFNPRSLSGKNLSLMCLESVQTGDSSTGQQILSVLGRQSTTTGFRLLTNDPNQADAYLCAPAFSGILNICESYGDSSSNQGPIPVPAAPAPRLPDGLRQRFLPFGSGRPTTAPVEAPEEASVPAPVLAPPIVVKREPETPRKRKKHKRVEVEDNINVPITVPILVKVEQPEQDTAEQPTPDTQVPEERKEKKKKKKKDKEKDRETVVVKTEEVLDPYVIIKPEPLGGDYVDSEPVPKKKKKKKSKTDD